MRKVFVIECNQLHFQRNEKEFVIESALSNNCFNVFKYIKNIMYFKLYQEKCNQEKTYPRLSIRFLLEKNVLGQKYVNY